MTYIGKVSGGKVILPPEANFSEGTEVQVQRVLVIGSGDGPSDLAENHDYCAQGAPKGIDRE